MSKPSLALLGSVCALASLFTSTPTLAGLKVVQPVLISEGVARGGLGAARGTTDTTQVIGCEVSAAIDGPWAFCFARNAERIERVCFTDSPTLIAAMPALNGDSLLTFRWDSKGECTSVHIYNGSEVAPKIS
jgi:hypothetical protein